jgi:hypothetical protein
MSNIIPMVSAVLRRALRGAAAPALALGPCIAAPAVAPLAAQGSPGAAPAPAARDGNWLVSVNPLGFLVGGLTGEVERRLGGTRTGAIAASYWGGYGGWSYLSMDAKLRFYRRPGSGKVAVGGNSTSNSATDFEALSFGPMIGFQRISADYCDVAGVSCSATGLTAGATVDYGWRLGSEKQFAALAGAGVKTGFGFSGLTSARVTYPFLRLAVGYVLPGGR